MKKRFTVMLDEKTIELIKAAKLTPTAKRSFIEWNINKIFSKQAFEELFKMWNEEDYLYGEK